MEHRRKEYQKIADAVPGQNQELPESTGNHGSKAQLGLSKSSLSYDYSIMAAANVNMRFTKLTIYYLLIL
jgi:hypothetical protein